MTDGISEGRQQLTKEAERKTGSSVSVTDTWVLLGHSWLGSS